MTPRIFEEILALYSNDMVDIFSGGLVYEFTQEPNNYGLVKVLENGNIELLSDFMALQDQYLRLPPLDYFHIAQSMRKNSKELQQAITLHKQMVPVCEDEYHNLDVSRGVPVSIASELIENGVKVRQGKYVPLSTEQRTSQFDVFQGGSMLLKNPEFRITVDYMSGTEIQRAKGFQNSMYYQFLQPLY